MIKHFMVISAIIWLSATASASEYHSAWQETDQCYSKLEQALSALPAINSAHLNDLLNAYDRHANETSCTITFAFAESHLESVGYFTIIEYRDDLYRRKQKYAAIIDIFTDWSAQAKAQRSDFASALQARIDAKAKPYDLHEARMKWLRRNETNSGEN